MGTKNFTFRLIFIVGLLLLLVSSDIYAQRGRGRSYGRGHSFYHGGGYSYRGGGSRYSYGRSYASYGYSGIGYRYRGGYFHTPFYGYYVRPHFGLHINILPFGYTRIYAGPYPYYYNNGIYYSPYGGNDYRIVTPPLGAVVPELPRDAQDVIIDGQKYYVLDGTYYQEEVDQDNRVEYRVVGVNGVLNTDKNNSTPAQDNYGDRIGDRISKLPPDCRKIIISGKKYYESPSGLYYEEIISRDKTEYEVVGKPDE